MNERIKQVGEYIDSAEGNARLDSKNYCPFEQSYQNLIQYKLTTIYACMKSI